MLYFYISNDGSEILEVREVAVPYEEGTYNNAVSAALNGKDFIEPVTIIDPPYNSATEVKEGPVDAYDYTTDSATRTYTVRAKTQEELDAGQMADDVAVLREAGKDLALVLTELVQWTLDNTSMTAENFTPSVVQAFQDLKTIADRVK